MKCIYCLRSTNGSTSIPHCLPEALLRGGPALPVGTVCDGCNHYAGANLESVLVRHPAIALPLQLLAIPGKTGKTRKKLGVYETGVEPDAAVTFPVEEPVITLGADGIRRATVRGKADPSFDMDPFRRSLYHGAFNLATLHRGYEWALGLQNDPVRKYVRHPKKKERWTFLQAHHTVYSTRAPITAESLEVEGADIIRFRFFQVEFYVDLLNSGCLETARFDPSGAGSVIGWNWKTPKPPPSDSTRHFRVSILDK